jgi:hypothetical protein
MEISTRRWSERVSEASRILPKHRGASVSEAWASKASCRTSSSTGGPAELRELVEEQHPVVPEGTAMHLDGPAAARGADA